MRRILGFSSVVLGIAGVLLCAMLAGIGWWIAVRAVARLDRIATRLDLGLSEVDMRLTRVESRVNAARADLDAVRRATESIDSEKLDASRVRDTIERLLDRLIPSIERADALADSLRSQAAGLRTGADIADQLNDDLAATDRIRIAADKIDRAAESLNGLQVKVDALKSAKAVQLTRELVALARAAIANCELLAEGLTAARQEIAVVQEQTVEWRNDIVTRIYIAATASTAILLWGGLGQLCLIGWGRRQFSRLGLISPRPS